MTYNPNIPGLYVRDDAYMGKYLKWYTSKPTYHRAVNDIFGAAPVRAFAIRNDAMIVQEKRFPDVSFYQGVINWDAMRSQTDAVIIRAGQNLWEDLEFRRNYAEAKQRGMKRGIYWFYDDRVDPGRQAALLVSLIGNDLPEMEIYADWENSYGGSFGGLGNVVAFMQRIESLLPTVKVGMYSGYYFFREHSNVVANAAQYNYLMTKPLWLAWYTPNAANVLIPAPWTSLLLWQFWTPSVGGQYGAQSIEIDMNYFNGTAAEFSARYGGISQPEEPPTGETPMQYKLTALVGLNMRSGAGTSYPITLVGGSGGGIRINDNIESSQRQQTADGSYWYKVDRLLRAGVPQTIPANSWASAGSTGGYLRLDATLPDAPPAGLSEILWIGTTPENVQEYRKAA